MQRLSEARPLTVSQLNREARSLLESGLGRVWVEGEISNLVRAQSGHLYFRIKDPSAQVAAAFFRQRQRGPTIGLKNGDQVLVFGKISLYEARGDFQMIVEQVEPAGEGLLKRAYEKLKNKLAAEGLFDEDRKRELPALPARVGVITSPTGAAVRDILSVMRRRFPAVPVILYPAAVQGDAAADELLAALNTANERAECDVIILGRGGGSLEDLWAFNDEALARVIAESAIPVVSAVGHEIDFTIADFVADVRAPTPSGAAELVVPDQSEWLSRLAAVETRLIRSQRRQLNELEQSLDWLTRQLHGLSPAKRVERQREQLQQLTRRLSAGVQASQRDNRERLSNLFYRLRQSSPELRVQKLSSELDALSLRLSRHMRDRLSDQQHRLALSARALNSVSPLATLSRGYAIVLDGDGKALTDASKLDQGDAIQGRLSKGTFTATVESVDKGR